MSIYANSYAMHSVHTAFIYSYSCHEYCTEHHEKTNWKKLFCGRKKESRVASWFFNSSFSPGANGKSENFICIWRIPTKKWYFSKLNCISFLSISIQKPVDRLKSKNGIESTLLLMLASHARHTQTSVCGRL